MKNIIVVFALVCLYSTSAEAQSSKECIRSLQYATTYYKQGNYSACVRTLNEKCFTSSLLGNELNVNKSYKIKIESLRAIDYDYEADKLYKKFVSWINPYRVTRYSGKSAKEIFDSISTS